MSWQSRGVHTRLHYVVKSAGGIDENMRIDYLVSTYGFSTESAKLVLYYPVEDLIKTKTAEEIVELAISDIKTKEEEAQKSVERLNRMATQLFSACPTLPAEIMKWVKYI